MTDAEATPPKTLAAFMSVANTVMAAELGTGSTGDLLNLKTPILGAYKLVSPDVDLNDLFDARPSARHFNKVNVGLMDGHAKAFSLDQFYTNQTPPDKWFCEDPDNIATCKGDP